MKKFKQMTEKEYKKLKAMLELVPNIEKLSKLDVTTRSTATLYIVRATNSFEEYKEKVNRYTGAKKQEPKKTPVEREKLDIIIDQQRQIINLLQEKKVIW